MCELLPPMRLISAFLSMCPFKFPTKEASGSVANTQAVTTFETKAESKKKPAAVAIRS